MKPATEAGVSPGRREEVSGRRQPFPSQIPRLIIETAKNIPCAYSRECGRMQQRSIQIRLPEPWEQFPHEVLRFSGIVESVLAPLTRTLDLEPVDVAHRKQSACTSHFGECVLSS